MTAKEKAKELVDKFTDFGQSNTQFPIDAAITCVDEVIAAINVFYFQNEISDIRILNGWREVKQELEKL